MFIEYIKCTQRWKASATLMHSSNAGAEGEKVSLVLSDGDQGDGGFLDDFWVHSSKDILFYVRLHH